MATTNYAGSNTDHATIPVPDDAEWTSAGIAAINACLEPLKDLVEYLRARLGAWRLVQRSYGVETGTGNVDSEAAGSWSTGVALNGSTTVATSDEVSVRVTGQVASTLPTTSKYRLAYKIGSGSITPIDGSEVYYEQASGAAHGAALLGVFAAPSAGVLTVYIQCIRTGAATTVYFRSPHTVLVEVLRAN